MLYKLTCLKIGLNYKFLSLYIESRNKKNSIVDSYFKFINEVYVCLILISNLFISFQCIEFQHLSFSITFLCQYLQLQVLYILQSPSQCNRFKKHQELWFQHSNLGPVQQQQLLEYSIPLILHLIQLDFFWYQNRYRFLHLIENLS